MTTPRTDAVWADKKQNILEHARQLETELIALQGENENLQRNYEALNQSSALALQERDQLLAIVEGLRKGLIAADDLMNQSRGVSGLHLNGDIAAWSELRTGGRFEEWLLDFDNAIQSLPPTSLVKQKWGCCVRCGERLNRAAFLCGLCADDDLNSNERIPRRT